MAKILDQEPRASILIANRNYGQWVCNAIDSAFNQNYENHNIVIVDGASDDNSVENIHSKYFKPNPHSKETFEDRVVKKVTLNNKELILVSLKENKGVSESRNVGIEYCNADIIGILDADDEYKPNKLPLLVATMMISPRDIAAVYADYTILDVDTNILHHECKFAFDRNLLLRENIVHSGSIINFNHLQVVKEETGYFDRTLRTCEDYDLWCRLSEIGHIVHIAEPLSLVRTHSNNATNSVATERWMQDRARVFQKIKERNAKKITST